MKFQIPGIKFEYFDSIDSTNTEAKRRLDSLKNNCFSDLHKNVLVAGEQTAGRGRLGRKFYSPENTGIYFSLIYSSGVIKNPGLITATAAVAVCRAIEKVYNVPAKIKWVNDVFVNKKKVCGILTEGMINSGTAQIESAIIGIGINIFFNNNLPKELSNKAGGICDSLQKDALIKTMDEQKELLVENTISNLVEILDKIDTKIESTMEEYKNRSNLIGKNIVVSPVIGTSDKNYECKVIDITKEAKLVVKKDTGEIIFLDSGEVTLHENY